MEKCAICGKKIKYKKEPSNSETWHPRKYCSYECVKKSKNILRKARIEKTHQKTCVECQKQFVSKREDTEYCSNQCRQAAYRQRTAGGEETTKIKVVVLTGTHCRACKKFEQLLEEFRNDHDFKEYSRLFTVEYVNVDENPERAFSYNEKLKKTGMRIPSMVLLKPNGRQIAFLHGNSKISEMMKLIVKEMNRNRKGPKIEEMAPNYYDL